MGTDPGADTQLDVAGAAGLPRKNAQSWERGAALKRLLVFAILGAVGPARAQQFNQPPVPDAGNALGAPVAVHGVVKNALSGEPLPRALVLIDGGGGVGALTDGDGRFEISGVA